MMKYLNIQRINITNNCMLGMQLLRSSASLHFALCLKKTVNKNRTLKIQLKLPVSPSRISTPFLLPPEITTIMNSLFIIPQDDCPGFQCMHISTLHIETISSSFQNLYGWYPTGCAIVGLAFLDQHSIFKF